MVFSLGDSAPFEEWLLAKREYYSRQMLEALQRLADHFEQSGEYEQAKDYAQRQLDLERAREFYLTSMAAQKESRDIDGIATAAMTLGWVAGNSGDYQQAIAWYQESLEGYRRVGHYEGVANQLMFQAHNFQHRGDFQQAALHSKQAADIFRDVGSNGGYADCIIHQAEVALSAGLYSEARQHMENALAFGRELSDKAIVAEAELIQAKMDWLSGEDVQANRRVEEALAILHGLNNDWRVVSTHTHLAGRLALGSGDLPRARAYFRESLEISSRSGQWSWGVTVLSLDDLACLAVRNGEMERAARLFGAVERAFPGLPNTLSPIERGWREQELQAARAALEDELFQAQYDLGRSLPLDQVVAYALEEA